MAETQRYEIKKYPNRRFYDVTRSRHVTLADLYDLVRAGNEITVTDSATGHDITNVVLAQIILEHDPPKLDLFPASLLHQAIQANEQMVRKFIEQYFSRAMDAFVKSRQQFDDYLRRIGVSAMTPMAPFDWVRMLFSQQGGNPFMPQNLSPWGSGSAAPTPAAPAATSPTVAVDAPMPNEDGTADNAPGSSEQAEPSPTSLERQVAALREELAALRSSVKGQPSAGKGGRQKGRKPRK